ncbi:MAG: hypothetical protein ACM3ML_03720 [Micromonosporaceae bacterium]
MSAPARRQKARGFAVAKVAHGWDFAIATAILITSRSALYAADRIMSNAVLAQN